jgi:hypothetical protein
LVDDPPQNHRNETQIHRKTTRKATCEVARLGASMAESEEIERAGRALIEAAQAPAKVILSGSRVGGNGRGRLWRVCETMCG